MTKLAQTLGLTAADFCACSWARKRKVLSSVSSPRHEVARPES